ncbi:aspartyl beta-hydroxylase [Kineobactrum sediminis]|uniref:Aspartyl beta-hydroxylase n=1 Tax=Kineobactrum sediminis TaxID=1905677 RepID=A0A2N5Y586_9GAMM|nr:aspartyl/asparaginyl beta-hydroxylase domain-containing protein [Kineobactrum sediminis]PLW83532.1 aspartyl beta-hydroxylase [Kineobactrum sediminis]
MANTDDRLQQGLKALREGNAAEAEAQLQAITTEGAAPASTWLALAFARVNLGQGDGALSAVDQALALEPRNLRALLFKADHLDRMGQARTAQSFYQGALRVASGLQQVPPDIGQGLKRAQDSCDRQAAHYEDYLLEKLEAAGYRSGEHARFAESLDIACGKRDIQLQQPTRYYFPGLPQRAFYPREDFSWVSALEAQTAVIREELLALMRDGEHFEPYLEADPNRPTLNVSSNLGSMNWAACYLWREGTLVEEIAAQCPATMAALEQVPLCLIPGQMPGVLFSRLAPGARIEPHYGAVNSRLICHLPLIVPPNCGELRVGNHSKSWREGELLIFDDSMEHEAANPSSRDRIVLLFDIWRPELDPGERHWISQMLQAVKEYPEA